MKKQVTLALLGVLLIVGLLITTGCGFGQTTPAPGYPSGGMMGGNAPASGEMTVSKEQALKNGQAFIDDYLPSVKVEEPDRFYGYYTLHVAKDGSIYGMLSVNGYTGQVWYDSWHGRFIGMEELAEN